MFFTSLLHNFPRHHIIVLTLTLEEVYSALQSNETMKQLIAGFEPKAEGLGLVARRRSHERAQTIMKKANQSLEANTSLATIVRKRDMLLKNATNYKTKTKQLLIRKESSL